MLGFRLLGDLKVPIYAVLEKGGLSRGLMFSTELFYTRVPRVLTQCSASSELAITRIHRDKQNHVLRYNLKLYIVHVGILTVPDLTRLTSQLSRCTPQVLDVAVLSIDQDGTAKFVVWVFDSANLPLL